MTAGVSGVVAIATTLFFVLLVLGLLYKQSRTHQRKLQLQKLVCLYNNPKPIGKKGELQLQFPQRP